MKSTSELQPFLAVRGDLLSAFDDPIVVRALWIAVDTDKKLIDPGLHDPTEDVLVVRGERMAIDEHRAAVLRACQPEHAAVGLVEEVAMTDPGVLLLAFALRDEQRIERSEPS